MKTRYFVRVLKAFDNYRPDYDVALDEQTFNAVRGKGCVSVLHKEVDGKKVDVDVDEGAADAGSTSKQTEETFPLDTLTEEEREIILERRTAAERKKAAAEAKAKAKADEEKAAAEAKAKAGK